MYKHYNEIANVKLIGYTQIPPDIEDYKSPTDLIAFCARVSNPSNQNNKETSGKLLKYLIKNRHWSPFEMVNINMEITTTRDIARQILRHRSFSFQEFSQRYADPTKDLEFCLKDLRKQDDKNRQNSTDVFDSTIKRIWDAHQITHIQNAIKIYQKAIECGGAKECARVVLPEGNTVSRMYMNGSVRSWIHYCELRCANGTQLEHMIIADQCLDILGQVVPELI